MTPITPLRQRLLEDLQLHGLAAKTQDAYVRAVRQLAEYYHRSPDQISEEELRQYLLYLQRDGTWRRAPSRLRCVALKFFYEQTLQRTWAMFDLARPARAESAAGRAEHGGSTARVAGRAVAAVSGVPDGAVCQRLALTRGPRAGSGRPRWGAGPDPHPTGQRPAGSLCAAPGPRVGSGPPVLGHASGSALDISSPLACDGQSRRAGPAPDGSQQRSEGVSGRGAGQPGSANRPRSIPCAIRMPRICWRRASTCASFRSTWATALRQTTARYTHLTEPTEQRALAAINRVMAEVA